MSTLGKAVVEFSADTVQFTSDVGRASAQFERALGRMEHGLAGLKDASLALVGFGGIGELFKDIIGRTTDAERSVNLLNATLKSTGYAAGLARGDIEGLAKALSESSVFDDDEIRKGTNALLRFQTVQGDTFKEGARLAVDLAAAMGTSLPDAFTKVGRALSDPERGLRALREAGVFLTESQSELAKKLFATGDAAGAQKIILAELAKTVGGAAAGENAGLYGATKSVEKAWDAFLKTLGGMEHVGSRVQRILGGITTALDYMRTLLPESGSAAVNAMEKHQASLAAAAAESARMIAATQADVDKTIEDRRKKANDDYLKREERLRQEDIKGWVAHAEAVFEEADRENLAIKAIWDDYWKREEDLRQKDIQGWVEHAQAVFDAADEENLAMARIYAEQKKATEQANKFGFTFNSALEDAVINGKKLGDVLKSVGDDIARMIVRKSLTEPLGGAISGLMAPITSSIGGFFKGLLPSFDVGTSYVPHDMVAMVHQGEAIIPAGQNAARGQDVNVTFNVGSLDPRTAAHVIAQNIPMIAGVLRKAAAARGNGTPF